MRRIQGLLCKPVSFLILYEKGSCNFKKLLLEFCCFLGAKLSKFKLLFDDMETESLAKFIQMY